MKKPHILHLYFAAIVLTLAVCMFAPLPISPKVYLVFATGSSPDAYGNKIDAITITQNSSSIPDQYTVVGTLNFATFNSSVVVALSSSVATWITVYVDVNATLISSPNTKASCIIAISGVTSNYTMIYTGYIGPSSGFYSVTFNYPTQFITDHQTVAWYPVTGSNYSIGLTFQLTY